MHHEHQQTHHRHELGKTVLPIQAWALAVEHLMDFVQAFLTLRAYSVEHKELFNQQHATIIAALRNKDAVQLRATLEKNIMIGLELVHEEMQRFRR